MYDGGEGVSERFFQYLSRTKCSVIMGFPVDVAEPDPPDGLAVTAPYLDTAYVLVSRGKLTQATLKPGMTIAVGMGTAPHFYLAGALGNVPNYTTNTFVTQPEVLNALMRHQADAAMAWEPSVVQYRQSHAGARTWTMSQLNIQHAHWKIAALYPERNAALAARFNAALARLKASGGLAPIVRPYSLETLPK